MFYFRKLYLLLIFLLIPNLVFPQKRDLSLKESIKIALEQNLQFQSAEKSVDIARSKMYESIGGFLPTADAYLLRTLDEKVMVLDMPPLAPGMPSTKVSIDFTRDYQAGLNITQPLFTGGALWNNYRQNYYNYKAEEQKYRREKLSTIFKVKKAYYDALLTVKLLMVTEEAFKLSQRLYNNTKLLYEQGMASKFQLLNAEVEMENVKPQLIESKNYKELALLAFKNILQLDVDEKIELTTTPHFIKKEFLLDSLISLANKIRPEIQQMQYQKSRMDKLVCLSYASFSPLLALTADYGYRRDTFDWDMKKWQDNYSINLVLSIPLFEGAQRIFKVQQTRIARDQVKLAQKALKTGAELEIRKNYLKLNESLKKYDTQMKNIDRAEENVRIAELNYKEGLITSLEMSVAHMNLIKTKTIYFKTLNDYLISLAALELSVGIENIIN